MDMPTGFLIDPRPFSVRALSLRQIALALSLALTTPATLATNAALQVWSTPYLKTSIEATIWYPTDAAEQRLEAGTFSHRVAAQAPAQQPKPLCINY